MKLADAADDNGTSPIIIRNDRVYRYVGGSSNSGSVTFPEDSTNEENGSKTNDDDNSNSDLVKFIDDNVLSANIGDMSDEVASRSSQQVSLLFLEINYGTNWVCN